MDAMKAQLRENYSTRDTPDLIEMRARDTLTDTAYNVLDEILQERGVQASAVTEVRKAQGLEVKQTAVASLPEIDDTLRKGMGDFPKTLIMNIILASGYAIYGVALLVEKMQREPLVLLAAIVGLCAVLVLAPAATARALSSAGSPTLQRAMLRANWILIGFLGLCMGASLVGIAVSHMPDRWIAVFSIELGFLIAAIPWWLNIRALRSAMVSK